MVDAWPVLTYSVGSLVFAAASSLVLPGLSSKEFHLVVVQANQQGQVENLLEVLSTHVHRLCGSCSAEWFHSSMAARLGKLSTCWGELSILCLFPNLIF